MFAIIDIRNVLGKHFDSLKSEMRGNIILFAIIPTFIGLCSFYLKFEHGVDGIITTSLAVFIGLFINLLVLVITLVRNPFKFKADIRLDIIKETFFNITYIIIISIVDLVLFFIHKLDSPYSIFMNITVDDIFQFLFVFFYTQIILTILMIIKRIFSVFEHDMDNIKGKMDLESIKKNTNK